MSTTTLRREVARVDAEIAAARRGEPAPRPKPPFVAVTANPHRDWPAGKLWLDTGTVGPLGSHPLWVLLYDGSFTHVAWLVLDL
ncbi:hypothetical protein [Intrasporangium flavum]|uniref:hypothetical protein n=1 Tax=Intrasporangium flavum TaxID=1428657 RepID=UPI00096D8BBB|nr:hypothetical protein [Intrasporangium flavum]